MTAKEQYWGKALEIFDRIKPRILREIKKIEKYSEINELDDYLQTGRVACYKGILHCYTGEHSIPDEEITQYLKQINEEKTEENVCWIYVRKYLYNEASQFKEVAWIDEENNIISESKRRQSRYNGHYKSFKRKVQL